MTFASIFSGGGGCELGAIAAGITPIWAIERDPEIAHWHHVNLPSSPIIVADIAAISPEFLETPDILHASPDRKSTRLNSSHIQKSRMPSSA